MMKIGKAYKFIWSDVIVLCIDEDLETFTGVIIKSSSKAKGYTVGSVSKNWNSDSDWIPLKGKIKKL